jgi:hypothetical protein
MSSVGPRALLTFAVLAAFAATGCVSRKINVESEPPGATVWVDGQKIGETPCSMDFTHYGTREVILRKDGYETLTALEPVEAPLWQWFPVDIFTELLLPVKLSDERAFKFTLNPRTETDTQELMKRAKQFKDDSQKKE